MNTPGSVECRLVAYGTLIPGRSNHHLIADLQGSWTEVVLRGHLGQSVWRGLEGLPAFVSDRDGPHVPASLFESNDLPEMWTQLDAFEGPRYRRIKVRPTLATTGEVLDEAYVYEALDLT